MSNPISAINLCRGISKELDGEKFDVILHALSLCVQFVISEAPADQRAGLWDYFVRYTSRDLDRQGFGKQ